MIRLFVLFLVIGSLAACEQYREPQANCFDVVSRGPAPYDCDFKPLGGPDVPDEAND